jgi:hypothetical protein
MSIYRIEITILSDGTITLSDLPFQAGDKVEIVVRERESKKTSKHYPLRGKPFRYDNPFDSVAEDTWSVMQ